MLKKIPFLAEACDIVYSHQEHFNGSGYPRGLKGGEIPLGARIFSVADTLDAIISDRPYRPARTLAEASHRRLRTGPAASLIPRSSKSFENARRHLRKTSREINSQSFLIQLFPAPKALSAELEIQQIDLNKCHPERSKCFAMRSIYAVETPYRAPSPPHDISLRFYVLPPANWRNRSLSIPSHSCKDSPLTTFYLDNAERRPDSRGAALKTLQSSPLNYGLQPLRNYN